MAQAKRIKESKNTSVTSMIEQAQELDSQIIARIDVITNTGRFNELQALIKARKTLAALINILLEALIWN
jgi:hypothetical protein